MHIRADSGSITPGAGPERSHGPQPLDDRSDAKPTAAAPPVRIVTHVRAVFVYAYTFVSKAMQTFSVNAQRLLQNGGNGRVWTATAPLLGLVALKEVERTQKISLEIKIVSEAVSGASRGLRVSHSCPPVPV